MALHTYSLNLCQKSIQVQLTGQHHFYLLIFTIQKGPNSNILQSSTSENSTGTRAIWASLLLKSFQTFLLSLQKKNPSTSPVGPPDQSQVIHIHYKPSAKHSIETLALTEEPGQAGATAGQQVRPLEPLSFLSALEINDGVGRRDSIREGRKADRPPYFGESSSTARLSPT